MAPFEMLAGLLAPRPAPARRVRVPEVRGLFIGPCRHLIAGLGLRIDVVQVAADHMPAEGLVVDQAPLPGAVADRVLDGDGPGVASGQEPPAAKQRRAA